MVEFIWFAGCNFPFELTGVTTLVGMAHLLVVPPEMLGPYPCGWLVVFFNGTRSREGHVAFKDHSSENLEFSSKII